MLNRMIDRLGAVACVFAFVGLAGCDDKVEATEENLTGAWHASFGDTGVQYNLYPDGTFDTQLNPDDTGGSQLYSVSGFGKMPEMGTWSYEDGELVFRVEGRTRGGLEVASMNSRQILLKAPDGVAMFFSPGELPGETAALVAPDIDMDDLEDRDMYDDDTGMGGEPTTMPSDAE